MIYPYDGVLHIPTSTERSSLGRDEVRLKGDDAELEVQKKAATTNPLKPELQLDTDNF
jgi:hypothetical protein